MDFWWTVNGADTASDQASDGWYDLVANCRLRAQDARQTT